MSGGCVAISARTEMARHPCLLIWNVWPFRYKGGRFETMPDWLILLSFTVQTDQLTSPLVMETPLFSGASS